MSKRSTSALLATLSTAWFMVSAYLTGSYIEGTAPVCFAGQNGCETVQSSPCSALFGVPLTEAGYAALPSEFLKGRR